MPRDIPVGNGFLLVNFDQTYQLRDLYWPHVGQENHINLPRGCLNTIVWKGGRK